MVERQVVINEQQQDASQMGGFSLVDTEDVGTTWRYLLWLGTMILGITREQMEGILNKQYRLCLPMQISRNGHVETQVDPVDCEEFAVTCMSAMISAVKERRKASKAAAE